MVQTARCQIYSTICEAGSSTTTIINDYVNMDYCDFYCRTMHYGIYIFHSPTNALFIKLGKV